MNVTEASFTFTVGWQPAEVSKVFHVKTFEGSDLACAVLSDLRKVKCTVVAVHLK